MNLETLVPHKSGTRIMVDGEVYQIGVDGVLRDVPDSVAEKLLQNKSWHVYDGTTSKRTPAGHRRAKAQMALIGSDGKNHPAPHDPTQGPPSLEQVMASGYSEAAATEIVAAEQAKWDAAHSVVPTPESETLPTTPTEFPAAAPEAPPVIEGPPPVSDAPPPVEAAQPVAPTNQQAAAPDEDPPVPCEGQDEGFDWADPKPEYSIEWLKACADAYEVKYAANIGTAKLAEKIKAAMYE